MAKQRAVVFKDYRKATGGAIGILNEVLMGTLLAEIKAKAIKNNSVVDDIEEDLLETGKRLIAQMYVAKLMRLKGLTLRDIGDNVGRKGESVGGWLDGKETPQPEAFEKLERLYKERFQKHTDSTE